MIRRLCVSLRRSRVPVSNLVDAHQCNAGLSPSPPSNGFPNDSFAKANKLRCAVYCRKSHEEGLEQDYNSIDAQRDAGHAYIASQRAKGWATVEHDYDDAAYSGGNMERPALKRLMADIEAKLIDVIVVYTFLFFVLPRQNE